MWVTALNSRLKITQINVYALFITSWVALLQEFLFGTTVTEMKTKRIKKSMAAEPQTTCISVNKIY